METVKRIFREYVPPVLLRWWRERNGVRYAGNFPDWKSAEQMGSGYQAADILEKVADATRQVLAGNAVFERDSRLFFQEEPNYPLAACLLLAAAREEGKLRVVDFGGSLGSVFFQNRCMLAELKELVWNIVEQPQFVDCGKRLPMPECIRFHRDFRTALSECRPNVILFSSVLQYLPDYHEILQQAIASQAAWLLIDRTPLISGSDRCRIALQTVPASLYAARYPVHFIGERRLMRELEPEFELVTRFESYPFSIRLRGEKEPIRYHGFLWQRRKHACRGV